jgi:hypothetical protein
MKRLVFSAARDGDDSAYQYSWEVCICLRCSFAGIETTHVVQIRYQFPDGRVVAVPEPDAATGLRWIVG